MTPPLTDTIILVLEIQNKRGLHARPSAKLSKLLHQFQSSVSIAKEGEIRADKSLLDIMKIGAKQGTVLSFHITGEDAKNCAVAIKELFDNQFGDEDSLKS